MHEKNMGIENTTMVVDEQGHGQRLDQAIAPLFPHMGVRGRRRLWEYNSITVNGRARPCGFCVTLGDVIEMHAKVTETVAPAQPRVHDITLIHCDRTLGLAALFKPSGIHSAFIAGSPLPSVESFLPQLDFGNGGKDAWYAPFPKLLNRLDGPTSGMLLVAIDETGLNTWTQAEERGSIEKSYFAVLCGTIEKAQTVKTALNTANRQVTTILDHDTADTLRHTDARPLAVFEMAVESAPHDGRPVTPATPVTPVTPVTLVQCRIHKGARHQIRAHMASIGHPLLGDSVYGSLQARDAQRQLFLHHGRVQLDTFTAFCAPPWLSLLPDSVQEQFIALFSGDV